VVKVFTASAVFERQHCDPCGIVDRRGPPDLSNSTELPFNSDGEVGILNALRFSFDVPPAPDLQQRQCGIWNA
jgi:hypothetical protein